MALSWNNKETITAIFKSVSGSVSRTYGYNSAGMTLIDTSMGVSDFIAFSKTYYLDSTYNYWRGCHKISGLEFDISQPLVATGYSYVWEYYDYYLGWTALPNVVDNTNGLQNSGVNSVTWDMPISWRVANRPLNSDPYSSGILVRLRIVSVVSITQNAVQNTNSNVLDHSYAVWISDGNTYSPDDIYNFMVTSGYPNLVSKSTGGKCIDLYTNLIITNGTLLITDNVRFTVGEGVSGSGSSFSGNWMAIETRSVGGDAVIQLGYKTSSGFGYRGGSLAWNNGNFRGNYLYWLGKTLLYGSRFWLYGGGYVGLTINGEVELIDSSLESGSNGTHTWFFASGSSGTVKRSSIHGYYLYVYSPFWSFDVLNFSPGEVGTVFGILSGGGAHTVKINNIYVDYIIRATQRSCIALMDCENVSSSNVSLIGNYEETQSITNRFSFKIKVIDAYGNPLPNATVRLLRNDGVTALMQDLYFQEHCDITLLDRDVNDQSGTIYNRPSYLNVGDYIYLRGEILRLLSLPSGTGAFSATRLETGSTILGRHQHHDVYKLIDAELTDSNGEVFYTGSAGQATYYIIVEDWYMAAGVSGNVSYNPFTLVVEKAGYERFSTMINIQSPLDLIVKLKPLRITVDSEVLQ